MKIYFDWNSSFTSYIKKRTLPFEVSMEPRSKTGIIYSLVCTCKANNINPYEYLNDILPRINTHPHSKLYELLPYNWASSLIKK